MTTNISGKNGKIMIGTTTIADVRKVSFDIQSNNPQYATSSAPGHKRSVAGVKSGTVSFDVVLDVTNANARQDSSIRIGEQYTLLVYEDASNYWTYPVRIDSMSSEVDINEGGEVSQSYKASTYGAWSYPDGDTST